MGKENVGNYSIDCRMTFGLYERKGERNYEGERGDCKEVSKYMREREREWAVFVDNGFG